ncbi:MAG: hypothetical protein AAF915_02080 [Cyanobacteria bacterium P01_D01_bin.50]
MSRMIDQVRHISSQLIQLHPMAGNYIDYQVLVDKVFSDIYAAQFCLAIYDRQPIIFEFQYYKPRDEWRIQNFNMSDQFTQDVSKIIQVNLANIFNG